jgi:hypothetical protein
MQAWLIREEPNLVLRKSPGPKVVTSIAVAICAIALATFPSGARAEPTPRLGAAASVVGRYGAISANSGQASTPALRRAGAASPGVLSYLNAVSCATLSFCVAVGYSTDAKGHASTLIESWNGRRWSLVKSPNSAASDYSQLLAVSCPSRVTCSAVGRASDRKTGYQRTLAETWNGSRWKIDLSANASLLADNVLDGVSCTRTGTCTAVGYAADTNLNVWHTLIESWNGHAWSQVSSPNVSAAENSYLLAVSCPSSTRCAAVGYHFKNLLGTLVESWNGHRWSVVSSPNASATGNSILYAVSCASNNFCAAVGTWYAPAETTPTNRNLVETLFGNRWTLAASPNTSAKDRNTLNSVSCAGAFRCIAVGTYLNSRNGFNQTLVLTGNRAAWSIAASPNAEAPSRDEDNWLNGVSCVSTSSCTAVGYYTTPKAITQSLIETWNGHRWETVENPSR